MYFISCVIYRWADCIYDSCFSLVRASYGHLYSPTSTITPAVIAQLFLTSITLSILSCDLRCKANMVYPTETVSRTLASVFEAPEYVTRGFSTGSHPHMYICLCHACNIY